LGKALKDFAEKHDYNSIPEFLKQIMEESLL